MVVVGGGGRWWHMVVNKWRSGLTHRAQPTASTPPSRPSRGPDVVAGSRNQCGGFRRRATLQPPLASRCSVRDRINGSMVDRNAEQKATPKSAGVGRVSGVGCRVSGLGCRASGVGWTSRFDFPIKLSSRHKGATRKKHSSIPLACRCLLGGHSYPPD